MTTARQAIRRVERDGWRLARITGSHRIFLHPSKPGSVTIPGRLGKDLPTGTWKSILKQAGLEEGR